METRIVSVLGAVAKHILHSLRRAFIAIAIAGFSVAVIAAAATEALGAFLSKSFPTGPTHLAAAAMALAFGYAAAMTVAIVEILKGLVEAIELVVKETEKLAAEGLREAEKLGGEAFREAGRAGRSALGGAETVGRDALGATETVGRDAAGMVGGVLGSVEHGVGSVFHRGGGATPPGPNTPQS